MSTQTLKVGYIVAVNMAEGVSTNDCYVGEVQAVDEHGIRLTHIDWIAGRFTGMDVFIAWRNIECAQVATDEHLPWNKHLVEEFGAWQERFERARASRGSAALRPHSGDA